MSSRLAFQGSRMSVCRTTLLFSSERQGRLRAYHGREEPRTQPAASRHRPARGRTRVAFVCCNGLLSGGPSLVEVIREGEDASAEQRKGQEYDQEPRRADQTPVSPVNDSVPVPAQLVVGALGIVLPC